PTRVSGAVRTQLAVPLAAHLADDRLPDDSGAWRGAEAWRSCRHRRSTMRPAISVVVCTRDRPDMLATCLPRLRSLDYGLYEVVVVDNAPSTDAARQVFERTVGDDARFRYVREDAAGLSRARNRGLAEASAACVAYTDDDVLVDMSWLDGIAAGFARDAAVGCVTGLVPPAQLDHLSQHYFDRRFPWGRRMEPRVYTAGNGRSSLYPYSAGLFGTGANFAVDRDLMLALGGFDEALGAGSPARGGEDLDAFVRILRAGRSIAYEPSAVVWHVHRSDRRALRRQLFTYGEGLSAFITKYLVDAHTTREILPRLPAGVRQLVRMWSPVTLDGPAPPTLILAEGLGIVAGPLAYARSRRAVTVGGPR
ncbi:MAG: glycosyltransferase family 2 protein, partial [Acidimicrobiales bacterium]